MLTIEQGNRQKSEILTFAEGLFESSKIPNISGVFIELDSGHRVKITFAEVDNVVIVYADNVEMGKLKPSESRGYKYNFFQAYRKGMGKSGLTENEVFIKMAFSSAEQVKFFSA